MIALPPHRPGSQTVDYFIYLVDRTGHIFARREIDCDTVDEASALARTLADPGGWQT